MNMVILLILFIVLLGSYWYWTANKAFFKGRWPQDINPLAVFDFDGTICPSYPLFIEQVKLFSDQYDEGTDLKDMDSKQIIKILNVSFLRLPFILKKARKNVQKQLLELEPVLGIKEVLQTLKQRGFSLGILTSNSQENVQAYLEKYDLNFFDFVYTGNNIFGKEGHLKSIQTKTRSLHKSIYVGDETRDIEAAKKAGFTSIGVLWGYDSLRLIESSCPDFIAELPLELLSGISKELARKS